MSYEDIEINGGVTDAGTATPEDSDYKSILSGEGSDPDQSSVPAEESEERIKPFDSETEEGKDDKTDKQEVTDEEIVLEIGGKQFNLKQSEAIELLENASKMAEREKALSEREKSMNRDYTQKTQALAEVRKSLETSFGRMPEQNEMNALGKVWKAYFENPSAKEVLDQIITGTYQAGNVSPTASQGKIDPYIQQLHQKIAMLEGRQEQFLSSLEQEKIAKSQDEALRNWKSWVDAKAKQNVKITDEVDASMAPFVSAIRQAHPDWESSRVLDEAYRHATIDTIQKDTVKKVLTSADEAKKRGSIKITPKTPKKAESDMGYRDIILNNRS